MGKFYICAAAQFLCGYKKLHFLLINVRNWLKKLIMMKIFMLKSESLRPYFLLCDTQLLLELVIYWPESLDRFRL